MSFEPRAILVRHGETAWSRSGRHTSTTDLPLTPEGRKLACDLAPVLARFPITSTLSSPLLRARETCRLAGLDHAVATLPQLAEWNYGDYEGLTSAEIQARQPGWNLFRDGCPGGESADDVARRLDPLVQKIATSHGITAVFGHGHCLRVFVARWLGLPATDGAGFQLGTASWSLLGREHDNRVVSVWGAPAV
jgi:broad specificity phosphatase PhoE